MPDIFQLYAGSADAAPGKGAGETLESSADTYKDLKAIKGWRRILSNFAVTPFTWKGKRWNTVEHAFQAAKFESIAPELFDSFSLDSGSELSRSGGDAARSERKALVFTPAQKAAWDARSAEVMRELWQAKFSQDKEAQRALLLTRTAQLWHAAPRTPKVRWDGLEEIRSVLAAAQRNAEAKPEMADAPKTKAKSKKAKKEEAKAEGVPEGVVVNGEEAVAAPANVDLPPPDLETPERQESAIRFCPVCRYYLYVEANTGQTESLYRFCRNCGYRKADEKGGLVTEMMVQERAAEGYKILLNEFTRRDPRLPHIKKDVKCPDPACDSNHGKADPDVIYIKYDAINMLYLYICDICGHQWRSRR
jgi:ribA/ribD-fused uncharacterized protein